MAEPESLGPGLTIRTYRDGDRDTLIALWDRCGLLIPQNDPDRDIALWRASPNARIFVGEQDGRIVASACVGHDGHRGNPYYVAVDPQARKAGVGRRMMRHAEAWLVGLGIPKMNVMVRDNNEAVRGFYLALGYEETPRFVFGLRLAEDGRSLSGPNGSTGEISCTVTYLEMTARPKTPPVHVSSRHRVALLRARRPNVAYYRYLYNTVGEAWLWYERRALDDETLASIVRDDRVEVYVLYVDGVPAGYAELDRREESAIELAYFGLVPEFIGRGFGGYLLSSAIDIAWSHEPSRVWVETNSLDHPRALALYQKFGFKPYKQKNKTIPDPRLTGLIPAKI